MCLCMGVVLTVFAGVVLFPGCQLPLLLSTPQELHLLDRALAAPPPLTRLLAVLPGWVAPTVHALLGIASRAHTHTCHLAVVPAA